jgi:hypothetical protein
VTLVDLPAWIRDVDRRMGALEASHKLITNLLALSPYAVRLPRDAERDDRMRRPRRIPWPRAKQSGHL